MTAATLYDIVLFLHILAAVGIVGGSCLEHVFHARMRKARTREALLEWLGAAKSLAQMMPLFALVLLLCGVYMTVARWGWRQPWIVLSLALLVSIGAASPAVLKPRMQRVARAAIGGAPLTEIARLLADPVQSIATSVFTAESVGIVLLMAAKPTLAPSLVIVAVAAAAGAFVGRPRHMPAEPASLASQPSAARLDVENGR